MLLSLRKPRITRRLSLTSSSRTLTATTSPSCSTSTRPNLALRSSPSPRPRQAKTHGGWPLCCKWLATTPLSCGLTTVTFCSVHIHKKNAKKCVAATCLLQRLRAHMVLRKVDFVGGDFNTSALSTVGDVFSDTDFMAPGNALLWGIGAWMNYARTARAFSSCRSVHTHGELMHKAATSLTTPTLALHPVTRLRTSLSFFTFASPTSRVLRALCAVLKLSHIVWSVPRPKKIACVYASDLHNKPSRTRRPCPVPRPTTRHRNHSISSSTQRPVGSTPQRPV